MKAIEIDQISVRYDQVLALRDVSLTLEEGEFLGVKGPNGGGKSTLMKAILGFIPLYRGQIKIFGKDAGKYSVPIGYVPQFAKIDRKFPISVREVVQMGRMTSGISPFFRYSDEDLKIVEEQLELVGLEKLKDRQIGELSGGEFQKMLIARALAVQPQLLLLDEPTESLDVTSKNEIYELLSKLNNTMTIMMITHDMDTLTNRLDRVIALNTTITIE